VCIKNNNNSNRSTLLLAKIIRLDLSLCTSVNGMLGAEAGCRLADVLCRKREKPYVIGMNFVSAKFSFAIL